MVPELSGLIADENLLFFYNNFGNEAISTESGSSYHIIQTGLPETPLFNFICLPKLVKLNEIETVEASFTQDNLAFAWWVDADVISNELKEHLKSSKYNFFGEVPGLVMKPIDYNMQVPLPEGITISEIDNLPDFKKWVDVLAQGFGFNDYVKNLYLEVFGPMLGARDKLVVLGAYNKQGDLVSTASIIFNKNIAGFYNDSTLTEYRHKGIATALYQARIEICKESKSEYITLQTSPSATNIALKLGFKIARNYHLYICNNSGV